jgi:hypothetical protein
MLIAHRDLPTLPKLAVIVAAPLIAVVCACSSQAASPSGQKVTAVTTAARPSSSVASEMSAVPGTLVLRPNGVGPLRIGMNSQQVAQTGAATTGAGSAEDGWPRGCSLVFYDAKTLGRTPGDTVNATLSLERGLERISATPRMVTPEGIRLGSSIRAVRAAYQRPHLRVGDEITVQTAKGTVYRVLVMKTVRSIDLERRQLDCAR